MSAVIGWLMFSQAVIGSHSVLRGDISSTGE